MLERFTLIVLTAILIATSTLYSCSDQKSEYDEIIGRYKQWRTDQYAKRTFATHEMCNFDTVSKPEYTGPEMGIPEDLEMSFTDINGDEKLDALVTFNPDQCDGGNALMNAQVRVLVLSNGSGYQADDTFFENIESRLQAGWLNIENAAEGIIYGTYLEYLKSDGRCCPSIRRPIQINYKTKEMEFTEEPAK